MKNVITNSIAMNIPAEPASPTATAESPARTNADTALTFRPNRSSEYIMKPLASGNARLIPAV